MTASAAGGPRSGNESRSRRHYSQAPLVEAVLELRIDELPSDEVDRLHAFKSKVAQKYTTEEIIMSGGVRVEFDATGSAPPRVEGSAEKLGFRFRTPDGTELVQVRRNGLSYHKLPPYSRWEACFEETRALWREFLDLLQPPLVRQIGLRYVNHLHVPAPCDLKTYLRTFPEVSPDLSQYLSGYIMQLSLPQADLAQTVLVLRQAFVGLSAPNLARIVLDHDLVCSTDLVSSSEELWEVFALLHQRQNEVFEGCITDSTRELIA